MVAKLHTVLQVRLLSRAGQSLLSPHPGDAHPRLFLFSALCSLTAELLFEMDTNLYLQLVIHLPEDFPFPLVDSATFNCLFLQIIKNKQTQIKKIKQPTGIEGEAKNIQGSQVSRVGAEGFWITSAPTGAVFCSSLLPCTVPSVQPWPETLLLYRWNMRSLNPPGRESKMWAGSFKGSAEMFYFYLCKVKKAFFLVHKK